MSGLLRRAGGLGLVGLFIVACQTAQPGTKIVDDPGSPQRGGTFVMALNQEPGFINHALSVFGGTVSQEIYSSLVKQNSDLSSSPSLAQSWEISPDGRTYTFRLVDTTWHDGKPLTSDDVKFTIEKIIVPYNPDGRTFFGRVQSIATPDPRTVVMTLDAAFPPFITILQPTSVPILPKHLYEGTDIPKNPYNLKPVGTGPFMFKEWVPGDHVELVRNPNYFEKGKPYLDRVIFRFIPDPSARLNALRAGEVDFLSGYFPYVEYPTLLKTPGLKGTLEGDSRPASIANNVVFNLRNAPWSDVRVRQAIAHALDKELIVAKSTDGVGKIAVSHISSTIGFAHNPNARRYPYDVAKANALLDEAGHRRDAQGTRFKASLKFNLGDDEHSKAAQVLVQLFKAIGIELQLLPLEAGAWTDQVFLKCEFDMTLRGIASGPDPSISAVWRSYHSSNIRRQPVVNNMGYANTKVDALFDKAATESDQAKRGEAFKEIQAILMEDLPSIPIRERSEPKVWRDVVKGSPVEVANGWTDIWKKR